MKKSSFILPLILTIAAVVYLIWASDLLIFSIPGISAVLSSVIAIILIGKYKLDINRYLLMYIVTSLFSPAAVIAMTYAVSEPISNIYAVIVLYVIALIVMMIVQFFLLNIKIKSFAEKFILIILNPALYVWILVIALGIKLSIYGWK